MPLLVDFGLAYGAYLSTSYLVLDSASQGQLDLFQLAPDDVLADFSHLALGMDVTHQSTQQIGPLVEWSARTATVRLVDFTGELDPYSLQQAGLTAPGVIMRLRWRQGTTVYPLFYGYVDSWETSHESPEHAVVTVSGTDGFALLAQDRTELAVAVGAGETTGARVNRILNAAGWTSGARAVATGDSSLQATTMAGSALEELQEVAFNEAGEMYIEPDGMLRFRNRRSLLTDPRSAASQVTYGSDRTAGEIPYVDKPSLTWDKTRLINTVRARRVGGALQVASDTASVDRYGVYATPEQELQLTSDDDVLNWAAHVVVQDRAPDARFRQVTLQAAYDPEVMFPHMLGRRFGDRVTVVRRPPATPFGSIVDSQQALVRSVQHSWSADRSPLFTTVLGLDPVASFPYLVLDDPVVGRLDQSVLAY